MTFKALYYQLRDMHIRHGEAVENVEVGFSCAGTIRPATKLELRELPQKFSEAAREEPKKKILLLR
jgi:hypothetical protein